MIMRGLALEGGGARGAYHIGVVKALMEKGYAFDGFVGTSIGAINAAILAQGDFDNALELWKKISIEEIFEEDEQVLVRLADVKGLKADLLPSKKRRTAIKKVIDNKGVSTGKMKALLGQYIDEDKIRSSGKDYGLVTISISDRRPHELLLEEIPQGQLFNYVMASASFPGFRPEAIEGKMFLDGAFYNNCPFDLLIEKGYDEIIAVRTNAGGVFRKTENPKIKIITPRDELGNIMLFTQENSAEKLKIGYYDGLRFADNLRGMAYYIRPVDIKEFNARLMSLEHDVILKAGEFLDIPEMPAQRMLFEKIIPLLGAHMNLNKNFDYADFVIALLEQAAEEKEIERYAVYDYSELCSLAQKAPKTVKPKQALSKLTKNNKLANKKKASNLLFKYLLKA
jgi:NTE family protein